MNKAYDPTIWYNAPSTNSPINDVNLNKISQGLNTVDNRVIDLDSAKANQQDLLTAVQSVVLNESTGVLTITKMNGTTTTYDTLLEKVAVNFDYDATTQQLTITLQDGTTKNVDLSSLISQTEFTDSAEIAFHVNSTTGAVYADIPTGSITSSKLQTDFLEDVQTAADNAAASALSASTSASDALLNKQLSQSYAVGNTGIREGENTDNSKYYKEQAEAAVSSIADYATTASTAATTATAKAGEASTSANTALNAADTATGAAQSATDSSTTATNAASVASTSASTASTAATNATTSANTARTNADLAKSYTVGGTGTRSGEDTDNAKYYKEQAAAIVGDKGHIILDVDGTQYTGRTNLRFRNARISDDAASDTTNVFVGITDTEWTQVLAILA